MLNSPEQFNTTKSILEEKDFKNFIETREISPEDFKIIEELSAFDKDFFIDFHNFFSVHHSKEKHIRELENQIKFLKEDFNRVENEYRKNELEKKILFEESLLEFLKKYDPSAGRHLISIFERRKK